MKILRKKDEFKKMPDKSVQDILSINAFVRQGWKHCSKKEYKDFYKVEEKVVEKTEKPAKEKKNATKK